MRADLIGELAGCYRAASSSDTTLGGLIPTGNPAALWGYYLGFASIIPFLGIATIPFCFWQSFLGSKTAKENPSAKGMAHAVVGVVLGVFGVLIQVLTIFLTLAAIGASRSN